MRPVTGNGLTSGALHKSDDLSEANANHCNILLLNWTYQRQMFRTYMEKICLMFHLMKGLAILQKFVSP